MPRVWSYAQALLAMRRGAKGGIPADIGAAGIPLGRGQGRCRSVPGLPEHTHRIDLRGVFPAAVRRVKKRAACALLSPVG